MKPLAFYAHPMNWYGTKDEKEDIKLIKSLGYRVLNPGLSKHQDGYNRLGMAYSAQLIGKCEVVFFRAFKENGAIGSGVKWEIDYANTNKVPVLELPTYNNRKILDRYGTRLQFKQGIM